MLKRSLILFSLIAMSTTTVWGQGDRFRPIAKELSPAATDTGKDNYEKRIGDGFIGFGFVLGGDNAGAKINYGESREFIVGIGLGYRFVKWNGLGVDLYYKSTSFFLAQDSGKITPNNTLHNSEKITLDNFGGLAFDRFYFGKFFFDGGFYFDWTFFTKHVTWDSFNSSYGNVTKVTERQLVFTNKTNYGLTFRLGTTQGISLYLNYRLSKVFKPLPASYGPPNAGLTYPELPVYVLGITIGGHM